MVNKFGAKKTVIHGVRFDSRAEAMHYLFLKDLQRKRAISGLILQPKYDLVVNGSLVGTYTPDFAYWENSKHVCEETKGVRTEAFNLRAKLFQALHPHIELRINGIAAKRPKPISEAKARAAA
jgi:hypothetical protein